MAAEARDRSPASGLDFEDESRPCCAGLASASATTVERSRHPTGDAGRSKRGDFIVQLPDGARFRHRSQEALDVLAVARRSGSAGHAGRVHGQPGGKLRRGCSQGPGSIRQGGRRFQRYDTNKVLCDSEMVASCSEVAYRWRVPPLLLGSATTPALTSVSSAAPHEARRALRETDPHRGQGQVNFHGADEIQSLLSFQVRRMNAALDDATAGLAYRETRAAS